MRDALRRRELALDVVVVLGAEFDARGALRTIGGRSVMALMVAENALDL
jgi:hypothetical protein